jgi:hypothetical protein
MISKRHITSRGHSVLEPKNPSPLLIGLPTLSKRRIFKQAKCNSGTCDIKLNPT